MNPQDRLFGEIAVRLKLLTRQQVAACLQDQAGQQTHRKLGEVALAMGFLSQQQMDMALEHQRRILERRRGGPPEASTPKPAAARKSTPKPAVARERTPKPAVARESTPKPAVARESTPKPRSPARRAPSERPGGAIEESVATGAMRPRAPTPIERGDDSDNPLRAVPGRRTEQQAPPEDPPVQPEPLPPRNSVNATIGGAGGWTNAAPPSRPITNAELAPLGGEPVDESAEVSAEPAQDAAASEDADAPGAPTAVDDPPATPRGDAAIRTLGSAATLVQEPIPRAPAPEPTPELESLPELEPDDDGEEDATPGNGATGSSSGTQVGLGVADLTPVELDAPPPAPAPAAKPPPPPPPAPTAEAKQEDEGGAEGSGKVVQTLKAPLKRPRVATPPGQDGYIVKLLRMAVEHRASDLHIHSGAEVLARIDGQLRPMSSGKPISAKAANKVIAEFLNDEQWRELAIYGETDFAYEIPQLARFRVNVYRQQRGFDIVFRVIPVAVPTLEQLGLPTHLAQLTDYRTGLVLCTGPTGCGKTTTLAALINLVIQNKTDHVITVEDPVEFVYPDGRCVVNQREVRSHTESYSRALRAALREDPDIIVIAELRDLETISLAMSAAETGHLVLGTLHTASASQTINRLVSVFPAKEQAQVRTMLADSLRAVISQRLVPKAEGPGRVAALEVLMCNTAVANMVRDNKTAQLPSAMQTGKKAGMVMLDDSLVELVQQGVITADEARRHANKKERFGR